MINKDICAGTTITYKEVSKEEFWDFIDSYNIKWSTLILFPTDPYQEYYIKDGVGSYVSRIIAKTSSYDGVQNLRYWIT